MEKSPTLTPAQITDFLKSTFGRLGSEVEASVNLLSAVEAYLNGGNQKDFHKEQLLIVIIQNRKSAVVNADERSNAFENFICLIEGKAVTDEMPGTKQRILLDDLAVTMPILKEAIRNATDDAEEQRTILQCIGLVTHYHHSAVSTLIQLLQEKNEGGFVVEFYKLLPVIFTVAKNINHDGKPRSVGPGTNDNPGEYGVAEIETRINNFRGNYPGNVYSSLPNVMTLIPNEYMNIGK